MNSIEESRIYHQVNSVHKERSWRQNKYEFVIENSLNGQEDMSLCTSTASQTWSNINIYILRHHLQERKNLIHIQEQV